MIFAPIDAPEWKNVLPECLKEFLNTQKGLPAEKTVLIPEKMWINVFEVTPENEYGEWENHHEFWDLHMIASNLEYCWIAPEADCKPINEYNSDDDYQLFYGNTTWADRVTLRSGSMLLLAPGEVHLPGCSVDNDQTPHIKAVVKIHRSLLEKK